MSPSDLESEFAARGVPYSGGLLLLSAGDAIAFVRRACQERLPILGIDGMFVSPTETVSPLDHIGDFSSTVGSDDGNWTIAESFISDRHNLGMVFEVVLSRQLGATV